MSESETDLYPEEVDDTRRVELDEGETNPFKIREAVLELLEELEDSGNEGEEECHHLPWRGRCWRVRLVYVCVCLCLYGSPPTHCIWCRETSSTSLGRPPRGALRTHKDTEQTTR